MQDWVIKPDKTLQDGTSGWGAGKGLGSEKRVGGTVVLYATADAQVCR